MLLNTSPPGNGTFAGQRGIRSAPSLPGPVPRHGSHRVESFVDRKGDDVFLKNELDQNRQMVAAVPASRPGSDRAGFE
jgi:hypothetical protein